MRPTIYRLPAMALLTLGTLQSCRSDLTCSLVGCSIDAVSLRFVDSATWRAGSYVVTLDGSSPSCSLGRGDGAGGAGGGDDLPVTCSTSRFRAEFENGSLSVFLQTSPELLDVSVEGPEGTRSWTAVAPDYELSYPNGFDCDHDSPCRTATVDLPDPA